VPAAPVYQGERNEALTLFRTPLPKQVARLLHAWGIGWTPASDCPVDRCLVDEPRNHAARCAAVITTLLEPKLSCAVLPKQAAVPDVPPHHLNRSMPGLVHNRPLRCSCHRRGGRMPSPERMPSVFRWVQSGATREFLDHSRDVDTGQPAGLDFSVPIQRTEQRRAADRRMLDPALKSSNGASGCPDSIRTECRPSCPLPPDQFSTAATMRWRARPARHEIRVRSAYPSQTNQSSLGYL